MIATEIRPETTALLIDKVALRQSLETPNLKMFAVGSPTMTPRQVRELMLSEGVRAEDNIGSRGIMDAREARDYNEE